MLFLLYTNTKYFVRSYNNKRYQIMKFLGVLLAIAVGVTALKV